MLEDNTSFHTSAADGIGIAVRNFPVLSDRLVLNSGYCALEVTFDTDHEQINAMEWQKRVSTQRMLQKQHKLTY